MPTPPPPAGFQSTFEPLAKMGQAIGDIRRGERDRKEEKQSSFQLQQVMNDTADAIERDPSALGVKPENAPLAAKIVRGASKSQFAQYMNVLGPGIFTSKTPTTFQAAMMKSVDMMAEAERTGDENLRKRGYDLANGAMQGFINYQTTKETIKKRFKDNPDNPLGKPVTRALTIRADIQKLQQTIAKGDLSESDETKAVDRILEYEKELDILDLRTQLARKVLQERLDDDPDKDFRKRIEGQFPQPDKDIQALEATQGP